MSFKLEKGNDGHKSPWSHQRDYHEAMIKLIISRKVPIISPPPLPPTAVKTTPTSSKSRPKITLFDGITNSAIESRYGRDNNHVAALVYCSAGMIGGQLSSPYGTHWAQEEGTLGENPIIFTELTRAIEQTHDTAPTEYPLIRLDEVLSLPEDHPNKNEKEKDLSQISVSKTVLTPSYGFLIDNIVPLQLNGNMVTTAGLINRKDPSAVDMTQPSLYVSYIMQAAVHLGLTFEDEATNYMFTTNPTINSHADAKAARVLAQRVARFYNINDAKTKYPNIPQETTFNSSSSHDAFNAFSTNQFDRLGLRYAIKTLLFSQIDFKKLQGEHGNDNGALAHIVFKLYSDDYEKIEKNYRNAVRIQLTNQVLLTKHYNKNILITGAFGCGVYNNSWEQIATIYGEVLSQHGGHLKEVIICNKLGKDNKEGMEAFAKIVAGKV